MGSGYVSRDEDPQDYLGKRAEVDSVWRSNYTSVSELADKVVQVMEDQARGDRL